MRPAEDPEREMRVILKCAGKQVLEEKDQGIKIIIDPAMDKRGVIIIDDDHRSLSIVFVQHPAQVVKGSGELDLVSLA